MKTSYRDLIYFLVISLLFIGCSQKHSLSDLELKDGVYFLKGNSNPFSGKISSKYSNGKDSLIGSIRDGKFDGVVITYYENGIIKDSLEFNLGQKVKSKSFSEDGTPVCDCNLIYFNESKGVWMTSNSETVFNGICISYWDNKNKKSSKVIKSGKERERYEWYENGNIKETLLIDEEGNYISRVYGYENGKQKQKIIFEGGKVKTNESWYENGNQQFIFYGEWGSTGESLKGGSKKWYENGVLSFEKLENPVETGIYTQKDKLETLKITGIVYDTDGNISEVQTSPPMCFGCFYLTKQQSIGVKTKSINEFIQGMKNYHIKEGNGSYIKQ